MKKIFLIESVPDGLKNVKPFLSEINAECQSFKSLQEVFDEDEKPDLILLLASKDMHEYGKAIGSLKNNATYSRVPRMSLFPYKPHGLGQDEVFLVMPVDKLKFLSTLANILNIPHRRVFKILIGIQPEGSSLKYSGVSIDFSETGMAFECNTDLSKDEKIVVSFIDPKNRNRFRLSASIARKKLNYTASQHFYGVSFAGMTDQERESLLNFVTGSK